MSPQPAEFPADELQQTKTLRARDGVGKTPNRGDSEVPPQLGRYVVKEKLGHGGFADVFLAHDEELDRQVALKFPRADRFGSEEELRMFLQEAQASARLQHRGIVNVFDVGSHEGTPFIVLEYIRGRTLAHLLEHESISPVVAARMMSEIAEAISHAHERGLVHRDIKPQNILLDADDRPHIADFGLAVRRYELASMEDTVAGTMSYMAPEQIRGETHRIDFRTDIWALGVVFYQMLTGRLPFIGSTRKEVFQQVLYTDPTPPRQVLETIPAELERICLRCLARQMSDRYSHATDFATDIVEWLNLATAGSGSSARRRVSPIEPPDAPVVPRGLRSFDREDGDFFLRLIPGPRDRDGLPVAIRFWKSRIEERDCEETFAVGVLYGPSGCGKSSLVKAGLFPRLSSEVIPLYIDATSGEAESRLLKALHKAFKHRLPDKGLDEVLRQLRENPELRGQKKIVIVIDQFEQWLDRWHTGANAELVRALRQCDGGNVQAILMVRDDFWLPVSRLMHDLEGDIVEGRNAMLVDSFDPEHARRVLRELGVAYGRLPAAEAAQSPENSAFIEQAVIGLTEENRLYPVRLTVFVEMVKDRAWVPSTLNEMGGTEGVGIAFLETSVGQRASPARRVHEPAIRRILASLLPSSGQIKDSVRTRGELLAASQYQGRPSDFDAVIRLLDVELRLITHAQAPDDESRVNSLGDQDVPDVVYQLTHDFLVPSIREWLERQSRGSRRGRALLLLQEQAGLWNSRPSPRYLPSLFEWVGIWSLTSRREWTEPQRKLMRAAARRFLRSTLMVMAFLTVAIASILGIYLELDRQRRLHYSEILVSKLQDVAIVDVPKVVEEMQPYRYWTDPALNTVFENDRESTKRRLRAALALLPNNVEHVSWLTEQLMDEQISPEDFLVIRNALLPYKKESADLLQARLLDAAGASPRVRFRIACALAGLNSNSKFWDEMDREVAASLLREPATDARAWISALRPAGDRLRAPLVASLADAESLEAARTGCLALAEFSEGQVDDLIEVLVHADGPRYRAAVEALKRRDSGISLAAVRSRYVQVRANKQEAKDLEQQAKQLANLILAIWELGDPLPLRENSVARPDPRLRTQLIHGMKPDRIDQSMIMRPVLQAEATDPTLNIALIAMSFYLNNSTSVETQKRLRTRLRELYRQASDPETHALAGLLARRLGDDLSADLDREIAALGNGSNHRWFITKSGLTMVIVSRPDNELRRGGPDDGQHLPGRFAISSTEVPLELYKQFETHLQGGTLRDPSDKTPVTGLLALQMAAFCNWLSERDGIPSTQFCYPPAEKMNVTNCRALPDALQKTGYRLPSVAEWELAAGCGSTASRFYGDDPKLLSHYGWEQINSGRLIRKVGELLPNPLGLFDIYGNAEEVCVSGFDSMALAGMPAYFGKGGSSLRRADAITTMAARPVDYRQPDEFQGFRVVRSLNLDAK